MNIALIEVNSTNLIIERGNQLNAFIERRAAKDANYFRLTAIIEQMVSSTEDIIHEETVYLNTQSMNMMYCPPYILDDDVATNFTTVWVFTPSGSSSTAFVVRNYATPGATMQFTYNPSKNWWDITFDKFRSHDITIIDGDKERVALYTEMDGNKIYLVNISAIKGEATDDRKTIVGATLDMVRTSVNMWKTESVTEKIIVELPIAKLFVPLIHGRHTCTQPE